MRHISCPNWVGYIGDPMRNVNCPKQGRYIDYPMRHSSCSKQDGYICHPMQHISFPKQAGDIDSPMQHISCPRHNGYVSSQVKHNSMNKEFFCHTQGHLLRERDPLHIFLIFGKADILSSESVLAPFSSFRKSFLKVFFLLDFEKSRRWISTETLSYVIIHIFLIEMNFLDISRGVILPSPPNKFSIFK